MEKFLIRQLEYGAGVSFEEHAHEETQVTLFLSGQTDEWVEGEHRLIGPLDIVVKPAGLRHVNHFGVSGAKTFQFSLRGSNPTWFTRLTDGYRVAFCPLFTSRILSLISNRDSDEVCPETRHRDIANSLNSFLASQRQPRPATSPRWLNSIVTEIGDRFRMPISLGHLAERQGKHPVSVARAFRARYGRSVKQHVQQLRVKYAARLLVENEMTATAVSQQCGFSDQSHMNRVFKSHTGMTPVRYRRLLC